MLNRLRQAKADVWTMRRLYPKAEDLAREAGHAEAGADDLVVAALDLPDRVAAAALADCGVDRARLRAAFAAGRAAPPGPDPSDPSDGSGPSAASVPSMPMTFHGAVAISKADRSHVRSADILLAAIEPDDGTVTRALLTLGVDRDDLRAAVRARLDA